MQRSTPHTPVTSSENTLFKHLRSLTEARTRKKERVYLIEGIKMVEEAIRDDAGVIRIVAAPSLMRHHGKGVLKLAESKGINVAWLSERLLDALAESKTPQPAMAEVRIREHREDDLLGHASGLIVAAHHLQDPGNLGTIIRTSEAAEAAGVVITANTVDPYNAKAVRASMGSVLRLPLVHVADVKDFLARCRRRGYQTLAAVLSGGRTPYETDLRKPTVLVFGQEAAGLPQELMEDIDLPVRIPMSRAIDSLNVATAAAVMLYEAVRQRSHAS